MPCHAMLCHGLEKSLSERYGRGVAHVNQTWPHCVNQMGKTQSKPLVAWHGRGTAWEQHGMCELAFTVTPGQRDPVKHKIQPDPISIL
jgi:hypothetical protein